MDEEIRTVEEPANVEESNSAETTSDNNDKKIDKKSEKKRLSGLDKAICITMVVLVIVTGWTTYRMLRLTRSPMVNFLNVNDKASQALTLLMTTYVDSLSQKRLEEDAIKGMLKNLDPHTTYIPPAEMEDVTAHIEGNFSGIGVQFNMLNDSVTVISAIAKGPSAKAGIMPGDRIVQADNDTLTGHKLNSNDVMKKLKGPTGSKVKLTIVRPGEPERLTFEIVRDRIPVNSVDAAYMITPDIGYIKLNTFSKPSWTEFLQAMKRLHTAGMKSLMLDLRDNGGGLIEPAVEMAGLFLQKGQLVVYTEGRHSPRHDYRADVNDSTYRTTALAVLINERSASASEILAGAIQDNDRGIIVGRRSFGKGLVQIQQTLTDGSALRITVARYYTPTGRCIQKPYANRDAYYDDLNERYRHGEMLQADSTHFADSLAFRTPGGKTVYGGGGIMPDLFVPLDTTFTTPFYARVMRNGQLFRFAFEYADRHRKDLTSLDAETLTQRLKHEDILNKFFAYAAKQNIHGSTTDRQLSSKMLENLLQANIARYALGEEAFYSIINNIDPVITQTVKALKKP